MSPSEIATAVRWRLASDIETEQASHVKLANRIATLRSQLGLKSDDWIVAAAMAFEIERWFTAVESLFVRIIAPWKESPIKQRNTNAGFAGRARSIRHFMAHRDSVRPGLVCPANLLAGKD